jgi:hypothetical protein
MNRKRHIQKTLLIFLLGIANLGFSQTSEATKDSIPQGIDTVQTWTRGGFFNLTFGQIALSNWTGGGVSSITGNAIVNLYSDYAKGNVTWENHLFSSFGVLRVGGNSAPWIKSDDKIFAFSKVTSKLKHNFSAAAYLGLTSQFANGYESPLRTNLISRFAAPAYSFAAIGLEYEPNNYFSVIVAPASLKTTFVGVQSLADAGSYGVDPATYDSFGEKITDGKIIRNEIGMHVYLNIHKKLTKSISLRSKADFFSNYFHNPQNIDVQWDVLLAIKAGKYLTTTISTNLIYDHDINLAIDDNGDSVPDRTGKRIQFKEVFGLGLSHKF